jgi:hypothetical protein
MNTELPQQEMAAVSHTFPFDEGNIAEDEFPRAAGAAQVIMAGHIQDAFSGIQLGEGTRGLGKALCLANGKEVFLQPFHNACVRLQQ